MCCLWGWMEAFIELSARSAVAVGRLMGSQEGFGSSGSVVVEDVRWHGEGACRTAGRKDDIIAANVSVPSFWRKVPDPEHCMGISQTSSLHSGDVSNGRNLGNLDSHPTALEVDVKSLKQKSGKIERKNSGYTKRSRMVQMESCKSKLGQNDVNGISPELVVSSSASCNTSEKNQIMKQNNSSSSRRGDKRNSRVKQKSRCDPFSLKNGLVGFNSAAGGNNFLGMYGLKPDVFDITKFVTELPLHDLVSGNYTSPFISKDKGKMSASSNNDLMQSVRKAWSVLQPKKVLQAQSSAEIDNTCIFSDPTGLITSSSAADQVDVDKGDNCSPLQLSPDEVQESDDKIRKSSIADSPLYTPKDIFERLALALPKDLDLLLSDVSKTTSKSNTDPRSGKPAPQRTGLPPFPWSHSLSGNTKLGSDAVKLSANRTTCPGGWAKIKNPLALQKGYADLLVDFESLAFDQSLVPSENILFEKQENIFASPERTLSTSGACSTSKVAADECPSSQAAAQTLLDMAAYSKGNPCKVVKLLKKPSQTAMKPCKSKTVKRRDLLDVPNTKAGPSNALKVTDVFSSKKLRLSKDCITHTELLKQGKSHQSPLLPVRSPPRKLFKASNVSTDSYGVNLVKKTCVLKAPRTMDRPSSTKPKFWKPSQ